MLELLKDKTVFVFKNMCFQQRLFCPIYPFLSVAQQKPFITNKIMIQLCEVHEKKKPEKIQA